MHKMIIFMGGQGSGKGTIAKMINEMGDFNYIETGALFRTLPADSEIAKLISHGELVPDSELFNLIESKISESSDVILDGFPRTMAQAQWLINNYSHRFDMELLYMDITESLMKERIKRRAMESGRVDDANELAVNRRLEQFRNLTMPAIDWFRKSDDVKFFDIDSSTPADITIQKVLNVIKI